MTSSDLSTLHADPTRGPNVPRYLTEIVVPVDRYVFLQLPDSFPVGRARVTVSFLESETQWPADDVAPVESPDREVDDVEWWEEFEES